MQIHKHFGFTLVELIVAIVIISILGTLAFLSFTRQNADARDAIRGSDIKIISRNMAIAINSQKESNISDYIKSTLPLNRLNSGTIFSGSLINSGSYAVGSPNPLKFGAHNFTDPSSKDSYPLAIIQGNFGIYYQVAAKLENNEAKVDGSYFQLTGTDVSGIIKEFNSSNVVINKGLFVPY